jgi:SHS2 domain-containing protein
VVERWEHFPHGADVGVRGFGATRERAFEQGALALTGVMVDPDAVRPAQRVDIRVTGTDDEVLFVDWLNALVYETATRGLLFGRFEVRIERGALRGTAWGEALDVPRHQPAVEVKGATYTELRVLRQEDGTWVAQCVVDV